jgi:uncharacterized repeat protein (TIGR01451 family)
MSNLRSVILSAFAVLLVALIGLAMWMWMATESWFESEAVAVTNSSRFQQVIGLEAESQIPEQLLPAIAATLQQDSSDDYAVSRYSNPSEDVHVAPNESHDFDMSFSSSGIAVNTDSGNFRMRLSAYDGSVVGQPGISAYGSRVEYSYSGIGLTEWYVNGPVGLEQGFTVDSSPDSENRIRLDIALGGTLSAQLISDTTVSLIDDSGAEALRYTGLYVYDNRGIELPALLKLDGKILSLEVDPAGAQYPITIDPFIQKAKLTASDGTANDQFGVSVSVEGDTALVGAWLHDTGGNSLQGAAYIFQRDHGGSGNWGQMAKLTASDGATGDRFGGSVSVNGDTAIVSAHLADVSVNSDQGAAYIFERDQGGVNNWGQVAKLTASDGVSDDSFGRFVSVSGNTAIVGANEHDVSGNSNQGAAYIFERNQGGADNWGQAAKLTGSDGSADDWFGIRVSVDGDTAVVSAHLHDTGGNSNQGAAYVYGRNQGGAGSWGQVAKLTSSDGNEFDAFGSSVSMSGDTVVVGAQSHKIGGNSNQGAAYLFGQNQGGTNNWGQIKKLTASDGAAGDFFGFSVSVSGSTAVVGARAEDSGANTDQGAVYTFRRDQGGADAWGEVSKLTASDGADGDQFGWSVSASGDTTIVGADFHDIGGNLDQGAAYVFEFPAADLEVDKTADPNPVTSLSYLTYSITVTNKSTTTASSVSITDALPAGTTFVSATPSQGACYGSTIVTCNFGDMGGNATSTAVIVVRVESSAPNVLSNTATTTHAGDDPVSSNNWKGVTTNVTHPPVVPSVNWWMLALLALALAATFAGRMRTTLARTVR